MNIALRMNFGSENYAAFHICGYLAVRWKFLSLDLQGISSTRIQILDSSMGVA